MGKHATSGAGDEPLIEALAASQRLGMLGAAPMAEVIAHSNMFVSAVAGVGGTIVDLGSGGGIPGLVIAWRRPDLRLVLVDRRTTRTDHLRRLVSRLHLGDRVDVISAEAHDLAFLLESPADGVVSRGFGKPKKVIEAVWPILAGTGIVVVSEPPDGADRWTADVIGVDFVRLPSDPRLAILARVPRGTS